MRHYSADLISGVDVSLGDITVADNNDILIEGTGSALKIGASNITGTGSAVGLVINSAGANSFLNHQGREIPFTADQASGGIVGLRVDGAATLTSTLSVTDTFTANGNTVLGTAGTPSANTHTVHGTSTFNETATFMNGISIMNTDGTPQNLTVSGNLTVNGDTTLGDGGADIINLNSSDINLIDHANIPTSTAGTLLGFDSAGNVVRLSPESFSAISKSSTSNTEALALTDFVNAFNSAGTAFNGISFTAGDAINTGSLVLITNVGASRTVTTDVNESFAGQPNVSIPNESATADLVGATFTNNGTLYTIIAVDMESGTFTVDQNLTATISAGTDLALTLASNVEQYLFTGASTTATADGTNDITADELIDVSHGGDVVESLTALGGITLTGGPVGNIFIAAQAAPANTSAGDTLPTIQVDNNGLTIVGNSIRTRHIEDAAVTTVKIADASITNAKLVADSVSEANLIITNTPSAGQFLQADQTGATSTMTWASPTGTVGKFANTTTITGATANPTITITAATHGLTGTDIQVQVAIINTGAQTVIIPDSIVISAAGEVTILFGTAALGADTDFRVVLIG